MTAVLDTTRRLVGRRRKIRRTEAATLLASLAAEGLDLANDCMRESFGEHAAEIWADAICDITVISVMPSGCIPHGQVRYDQPGSMAPMQRADLIFVSARLGDYDYDQIGQMRRHAKRLLVVTDDPPLRPKPLAVTPEDQLWGYSCDNGHCAQLTDAQAQERDHKCPECGEYYQ